MRPEDSKQDLLSGFSLSSLGKPSKFDTSCVPGVQLPKEIKTYADNRLFLTLFSFFQMIFTVDQVNRLCDVTNEYFEKKWGVFRKGQYLWWGLAALPRGGLSTIGLHLVPSSHP